MSKTYDKLLQEANLSRVLKHMQEHDCGTISAERIARDCGEGKEYSNAENRARMRSLLAKLKSKDYGVIRLVGVYEGKNENSYFIFDRKDTGNLLKDLKTLGQAFDQDSVLFIPKGGKEGILHGTNKCPDAFPGWNKIENVGKRFMGKKGEIYTSKIRNRPFIFSKECYDPGNGMGYWAMHLAANKNWKELIEDDE